MCPNGFVDQNDRERKHFTEQGLLNIIENIQYLPLSEQKMSLKTALQIHMKTTEQRDDILLIGMKI